MQANSSDWTSLLSPLPSMRRGVRIERLIYGPALTALWTNCIRLFFYPSLAFVLFTIPPSPSREDQDGCELYCIVKVVIKLTIIHISLWNSKFQNTHSLLLTMHSQMSKVVRFVFLLMSCIQAWFLFSFSLHLKCSKLIFFECKQMELMSYLCGDVIL